MTNVCRAPLSVIVAVGHGAGSVAMFYPEVVFAVQVEKCNYSLASNTPHTTFLAPMCVIKSKNRNAQSLFALNGRSHTSKW